VLHSSPNRVHVLWRVVGFEPAQAEALQKMLAGQLGTDPAATASTQMTRLPGFFNHKYALPHRVAVQMHPRGHSENPRDQNTPVLEDLDVRMRGQVEQYYPGMPA
jgi:hypothetical protein